MKERPEYLPHVDGLRALAVAAVVLYHAGVRGFSGGFVGVDVFFVISGFLISRLVVREVEAGTFSLRRFYERRVRRILPALFALLVVSSVASYLFFSTADERAFGKDLESTILLIPNLRFLRTIDYFNPQAATSPLVHTWSLGIEEQFYIFFPFCFAWLLRRHVRKAFTVIVLATIISFCLCVAWTEFLSPQQAFFVLPTRGWELLLGTAIAMRSFRLSEDVTVRNLASAIAVCSLIASVSLIDSTVRFPGFAAAFPALATAAILDANRGTPSAFARLLSAKPLVGLGLISYSLYLWHWPLLAFAHYNDTIVSTAATGALLAVGVLISILSWKFIESPIRTRGAGSFTYGTVLTVLGIAGILLGAFSMADRITDGFPKRYSPLALEYLNGAMERDPDRIRCSSVRAAGVTAGGLCRFGPAQPSPARILVWGDSHAVALLPALRLWGREGGVAGLIGTRGGCPPALGVSSFKDPACREFNDSIFALIRRSGIRDVVLVAFWNIYGERPSENFGYEQALLGTDWNSAPSPAESQMNLDSGLMMTVSRLRLLGVHAYIMPDVPVYHDRGFLLRVANAAERGHALDGIGADTSTYRAKRKHLDSLFARIQQSGTVTLLDPFGVLCTRERCDVVAEGHALYADGNHLSSYGAMRLKELFAPLFAAARERIAPK